MPRTSRKGTPPPAKGPKAPPKGRSGAKRETPTPTSKAPGGGEGGSGRKPTATRSRPRLTAAAADQPPGPPPLSPILEEVVRSSEALQEQLRGLTGAAGELGEVKRTF